MYIQYEFIDLRIASCVCVCVCVRRRAIILHYQSPLSHTHTGGQRASHSHALTCMCSQIESECHGKLNWPCTALIIVSRETSHSFTIIQFCRPPSRQKEQKEQKELSFLFESIFLWTLLQLLLFSQRILQGVSSCLLTSSGLSSDL